MRRMKCGILAAVLAGAVFLTPAVDVYAHGHHGGGHCGGYRTSYYYCGGHAAHTHTNGYCPYSSDDYYYHCGGYGAHHHEGGVCPYADLLSRSTVLKVQKKLNRYGYNCGTADGVMGAKTKKALKKFQKDNYLKADGLIGQKTLTALGL